MPRALLLLAILFTFAGPARGVDLLTNHIGFTVNDPAGLDWKQFKGNIGAFDDTPLHFYSQQTGTSFTGWSTYFRLARVDSGTTLTYFSVTPSQITVGGTNINLVIPRTNVPPENTYLAELWATNGPNARTLARGKITVTYSLYTDATYAPVVLSSAYLPLAGGVMTGPVTNQYGFYGNGAGLSNITAVAVAAFSALTGDPYDNAALSTNFTQRPPSNTIAAMIAAATNGLGAGQIVAVTNDGAGIVTVANAGGPTVTVGVAASAILAVGASNYYPLVDGRAASNLAASLVSPLANVSGRVVTVEGWGNHASAGYWQDGMMPDKYISAPNGGRLVLSSVSNGPVGITWTDDGGNELLTVYGLGGAGLVGGSTNTYESYVTYLHTGSPLNGTNLLAYSISSNKLDAATDAAYRSGGTGSDTNAAYAVNINGRIYTPTGASQVVSLDSAVATNWNTLWTKGANLAGPSAPAPVDNGGYVCKNAITFEDSAAWACYWDIPPGPSTVQVRSYWMTPTNQAAGVSVKLGFYSNNVPGSYAFIYQQYALTSGVQFITVTNLIPVNPLSPNIGLLRDGAGSDTSTNKLYLCGVDWRDTASPNWVSVGQGGGSQTPATNHINMAGFSLTNAANIVATGTASQIDNIYFPGNGAITNVSRIDYTATAWTNLTYIDAFRTNVLTVPNVTATVAVCTSEAVDTLSEYNSSTGEFRPANQGVYMVSYQSMWQNINVNIDYFVSLVCDGVVLARTWYYGPAVTYFPITLSYPVLCTSTSIVTIQAYQASGGSEIIGLNVAGRTVQSFSARRMCP